jgi:hypothetical protein
MSLRNKKLVAILGGRPYKDSSTLRIFMIPSIRERLKKEGIDFIIATNNSTAAKEFKQIRGLSIVETSYSLKKEFEKRRREIKTNLGAETRETINQYAIKNNYDLVLHLDDNITNIFYSDKKNKHVKKNKPLAFYEIIKLLFYVSENSNSGAIGIGMASYPSRGNVSITAGFPYSMFVHRIDKKFKFENSTEDDIIMSIYNGINKKPSCILRNCFSYGKTGKKKSMDGNRKLYQSMLKENKRGEYAEKTYPEIYSRKVSYMVKSSTYQKEPFLQHKHTLKKPSSWYIDLKIHSSCILKIHETLEKIKTREQDAK